MAPEPSQNSVLVNPLATPDQLSTSGSQLDGVPASLETSVIHIGARLTQIAGVLLRLPQDLIAHAVVIFTRFWLGPESGSLCEYSIKHVCAAALYLTTKPSAHPKAPRSIINVLAYIEALGTVFFVQDDMDKNDPESYYVSEGTYFTERAQLTKVESIILRVLGFNTHVALPYTICINYLQTLGVFDDDSGSELAKRAWAHLNSALLSPQLLFVTHQPPCLATAAIYLAAKEVGVKLPSEQWWEVFDTDREELGFLVVAMLSMEGFLREEKQNWAGKRMPYTLDVVEQEIKALTDNS
ncbi:hypothetical protein BT63DRAFT_416934 [Microthyrium microscopicum]|uniref:Cyclin-L2 n=1 Tax=Microthyrium microscopicum TaxID=703497 RepID=A0A6A6U090_9PEZI|nr:hypothetical protein BT63DRAFT_416934 [Microthyrium microscopicum]